MRRATTMPIAIIYDWTCADCGRHGSAVARVGDNPEECVRLSHFYTRRARPHALPSTPCNPDHLTFQLRGFES